MNTIILAIMLYYIYMLVNFTSHSISIHQIHQICSSHRTTAAPHPSVESPCQSGCPCSSSYSTAMYNTYICIFFLRPNQASGCSLQNEFLMYMYIYMCVCMHACMRVCMFACMHVCKQACMHVCMFACMHVCLYVGMHVCMYVCM
jgi:hypothetical protein